MVVVNGEEKVLTQSVALQVYLEMQGYDPARVAVERNGSIVPRAQYESTPVQDGDYLEVVRFVGGG